MNRRARHTLVVAAAAFLGGVLSRPAVEAAARGDAYAHLGVFARALTYVENNYVDAVDPRALVHGAIDGMMATLDPHSAFLDPEAYEAMRMDTGGAFGGVGLELAQDREGEALTVVAPLADTPAERAGLRSGDRLLAIDGTETAELGLTEAVRRLRGPPGTRVVLKVMRPDFRRPRDLPVVRGHVLVNPVEARRVGGYGVVRIRAFQERTSRNLREALDELRRQGQGTLPGLVLDLRGNPGGLVDEAVAVADLFLEDGVIVTTRGRGPARESWRAHRRRTEPAYPMVVLVDQGSASASEIVAGALQDHGRALVAGTRTFGKASVQTIIDLDDGSGLKLTVGRYYTPAGRSLHGEGVEPDLWVQAEASGAGEVLDRLRPAASAPADPQLVAALEALAGDHSRAAAPPRTGATRPTARGSGQKAAAGG